MYTNFGKNFIMNKRRILASLNNIANSLDHSGLYEEANVLSSVMKRMAQQVPQTQQPNQIPQTGQQPQQQNFDQQGQLRGAEFNQIYNQCNTLIDQIYAQFEKLYPILHEIYRKISTGMQLQQSQDGYNSILMCNNILNYSKTLNTQLQNLISNLQIGRAHV